ncbi:hypothetical protein E2C01_011392 [Portunus trituberculatus]|uniref:Uncharacterized protein n=1 Tax=Portunus trituberculatus TaxID=210409 RepID=A0A5B7DAX2_PORTR|nr:hypothetical protein [Portunus trituberculatus]
MLQNRQQLSSELLRHEDRRIEGGQGWLPLGLPHFLTPVRKAKRASRSDRYCGTHLGQAASHVRPQDWADSNLEYEDEARHLVNTVGGVCRRQIILQT